MASSLQSLRVAALASRIPDPGSRIPASVSLQAVPPPRADSDRSAFPALRRARCWSPPEVILAVSQVRPPLLDPSPLRPLLLSQAAALGHRDRPSRRTGK